MLEDIYGGILEKKKVVEEWLLGILVNFIGLFVVVIVVSIFVYSWLPNLGIYLCWTPVLKKACVNDGL